MSVSKRIAKEMLKTLFYGKILGYVQFDILMDMVNNSEESEFFVRKAEELHSNFQRVKNLYGTDGVPTAEKEVLFHYFSSDWDWYIVEIDKAENLAFGFVDGFEGEWGYISLDELATTKGIELDLHFTPKAFGDIKTK